MARSKRGSGKTAIFAISTLLIAVGIGTAGYLISHQTKVDDPKPAMEQHVNVHSHNLGNVGKSVDVYVIQTNGEESLLVPVRRSVPAGVDSCRAAIEKLVEEAGSSASAIPKGTKLRSIQVSSGLATIDFSGEFLDNFNGGSEDESLAINSILKTLGQFKTVKYVQLLVDGRKVGTLGGHFELEMPITVQVSSEK